MLGTAQRNKLVVARLLANGFLQEVMKGWLISSGPGVRPGDSTPWYASFWEFYGRYCSELPFGTSLYDLKQSTMPGPSDVMVKEGLRLFSPSSALVKVTESFFGRPPIETQVALTSLRDASDLLRILLTGGNSVKAGVLAGALRRIGRSELADEVLDAMKAAGYDVRESDPFERAQTFSTVPSMGSCSRRHARVVRAPPA